MSKAMEIVDNTPELLETVLLTFNTDSEKELARKIVRLFLDNGFPVKVKQYYQACMQGTYRILCLIKKGTEAVIINNKGMGRDGVSFQVRFDDRSIFEKLDSLSENVRNQIINAANCGYCSTKCDNKKYIFTYQGQKYVKCRFLCNNFTFQNLNTEENNDLLDIVNNEIKFAINPAK
ncbi:MAG: hypothetical protein WCY62_03525 [Clostridia bacterium]|jgi:hypothetical protein